MLRYLKKCSISCVLVNLDLLLESSLFVSSLINDVNFCGDFLFSVSRVRNMKGALAQ